MLFEWSDDYSVKLITFDEHHRRLIKLINELHDAMMEKRGQAVIGNILKSLVDYTRYHFGEEERLMVKYNYDGLKVHKAEHDAFVKQITDLQTRASKNDTAVTIELRKFLKDWLVKHIQNTDKNYTEFFKGLGLT